MTKILQKFSFLLCLCACQQMTFHIAEEEEDFNLSPSLEQEEEPLSFTSDQLDMALILDSQKGMEKFYRRNVFGEGFLDKTGFDDWKIGHTAASVSPELKSDAESREKCGFREFSAGGGLTAAGVYVHPVMLPFGFFSLRRCLSSVSFRKGREANGDFLPFELRGKALSTALSPNDSEYQTIFHHTVTKGTDRPFVRDYDSPRKERKKAVSSPLQAMFLSLAKGEGFFRDDSYIAYISLSPVDADEKISGEDLKQAFEKLYGDSDRLIFIPAVIEEGDAVCALKMKEMGVKNPHAAPKLSQLAKDLNMEPVNLCSPSLGQDVLSRLKAKIRQ